MTEVVPIPLRHAAKAVHFGVGRIRRDYIETGKLRAFKYGGAPDAPRLRVYLRELLDIIEADRLYVPAAFVGKQRKIRRRPFSELHPDVAKMYRD
jgi:hypothetical protein